MYLFEQLKKIVRSEDTTKSDPPTRYVLTDVEIDNPLFECKISVPAFKVVEDNTPDFVSMKADTFGLQTLFDAGVNLTPTNVVTTSFLRETEKFMDSVTKSKI